MFNKVKNYLNDYYSEESKNERKINAHMKVYKVSREDAIEKIDENRIKLGIKDKENYLKKRNEGILCCPVCLSENISTNKKGFSVGKAVLGASTVGTIGIAAGDIGSNKIKCTCLDCNHKFRPKFK